MGVSCLERKREVKTVRRRPSMQNSRGMTCRAISRIGRSFISCPRRELCMDVKTGDPCQLAPAARDVPAGRWDALHHPFAHGMAISDVKRQNEDQIRAPRLYALPRYSRRNRRYLNKPVRSKRTYHATASPQPPRKTNRRVCMYGLLTGISKSHTLPKGMEPNRS